jgi:RNA recognition motif-containing protein
LDFSSNDLAKKSLGLLEGLELNGRMLKIDLDGGVDNPNKGRRLSPVSSEFSVFIGNMDFNVQEENIRQILEDKLGEDVLCKIRFSYSAGTRDDVVVS